MKKTACAIFLIILLTAVSCSASGGNNLYSDVEEGNWKYYLISPNEYEKNIDSYFVFGDKSEDGNRVKYFRYTNPPEGTDLNVRCKSDFETPVSLSENGLTVIHCKIKLTGNPLATYQLRAYTSSGQQEILMGFGENVTIYKNHIPQSLNSPVYCDFDAWHSVDIVISGKEKTMMHYFDGKAVSGKPIALYTFSDNTQFVGPYDSLAVVCYSGKNTGTQEFLLDDVRIYNPSAGAAIATTPEDGAKTISPNQTIKFKFNNYIDEKSLEGAYAVINGDAARVSVINGNLSECIVEPVQPLKPNTSYSVSVDGLRDIFGNSLQAELSFSTSSGTYIKKRVITVENSEGETRDITNAAITGGKVTANLTLGNETGNNESVKALFALFDEEKLVRVGKISNASISAGESEKEIKADIVITETEAETLKLELFVFNDQNLTPIGLPWQSRFAYFVSPQGSDGNPGSFEKPFKSLEKAARIARAGDIVIFEDGTYYETRRVEFQNGGTKESPILLKARNKGKAAVTFMSSKNKTLKIKEKITIPKTSGGYITIKDFVITQDAAATSADNTTVDIFINCRADNCSVIGNEVYNCYEEPIKAADVTGLWVKDNIVYESAHEGIDLVNVSDSIISGNTVGEIGRVGIMVKGGSRNILMYNNTVYNETKSMETAISIGGATDSASAYDTSEDGYEGYNQYVWNNVVYVKDKGKIDTAVLFDGSKDCRAFNNTLVGTTYAIRFTKAPGISNGWRWNPNNFNPTVYNNLISGSNYGIYETDKAESLTCDYNMFYNCKNSSTVDGENNQIITEPKFKNEAAQDFGITENSPAKFAGYKLSGSVSGFNSTTIKIDTADRLGNVRGSKWSVGAYQ